MSGILLRRAMQALVVLFVMSFLVYGLIGLMPGDPIDLMVQSNPHLTPADALRLKTLYGVDRPLVLRWWSWLQAAMTGDLGYSRLYGQPVLTVLWPRLCSTLLLMGASLVLGAALALPAGVAAAQRPGSWIDRLVNLLAFGAASVPSFWLALLLIVVFSVELGWLPAGGDGGSDVQGLAWLRFAVLPVITLALLTLGSLVRYVRSSMIEVLREDFIRTARAKGCSERRVVWCHGLGAALPPLLTVVALQLGSLLSGALVVETVFAWSGMGKLIYNSVLGNDFNLALAALLLATATTLGASTLADVVQASLDPRVALEG